MKTLKVEAVYPMAYEIFADVAQDLPRFIDEIYNARPLHSASRYVTPQQFEDRNPRLTVKSAGCTIVRPKRLTPIEGQGSTPMTIRRAAA
jgi:hypothetical protein